jgi:low affinity Fe/Cu permease
MRSFLEIVNELMVACREGKARVGTIMVAVVSLLIGAVVVAIIGEIFPISDYWPIITVVFVGVLAIIGEVL